MMTDIDRFVNADDLLVESLDAAMSYISDAVTCAEFLGDSRSGTLEILLAALDGLITPQTW